MSLKSYFAVALCSALSNQDSPPIYVNWTQADNGGRTLIVFGNFSQIVPRANLAKFICTLASALRLHKKRVFTQYADTCSNFRTRMLQTVISTTAATTSTTVPAATVAVHSFNILADPTAAADTTYEDAKALISTPTFVATIKAKLKPDYLGSTTFIAMQPVRSKSIIKPTIPVFATTKQDATPSTSGASIPFTITGQAGYVFIVVGD